VTQVNAGKNTPGVDKLVIKTPEARAELVKEISTLALWKAKPARRIYIPKANGKLRPLGIPVIKDRCLQAMVKNALEPEWEAKFEGISYGFRPGRSCHDAIAKIYSIATPNKRKRWVVDADIKGAFDNISHQYLETAIGYFPAREMIRQWLKAGYMEKGQFHETETGTPQGGVASPLLANIALHGIEEALTTYRILRDGRRIKTRDGVWYRKDGEGSQLGRRTAVRYADDFAVFCESREDAEKVVNILTEWLKERGLVLSPEKTRIVHLSEGFDFLGFNIRQFKTRTRKSGWKLLIRPSKESVKKIREKLRIKWRSLRGREVSIVLKELNPIIRGWANYFRIGVSYRTFSALDHWMVHKAIRYAKRTHPTKPKYWWQAKYFGQLNNKRKDQWVFGDKRAGAHLLMFKWHKIERHILIKGKASPDNPELREYWEHRKMMKVKDLTPSRQKVAKAQNGVCPICGDWLFNEEELHNHHKKPKSEGGGNCYDNLILVHLYCHQQIHSD
jgi:RNA-directed DNA polymerase